VNGYEEGMYKMKRRILWIAVAVVLVVCLQLPAGSCCSSGAGKWCNSLKPQGKAGPMLTLVKDGKSDYVIVIGVSATQPEVKAAEQLQYWLEQMTAVKLPIVIEDEDEIPAGKSGIISVGKTALLQEAVPSAATEDLGNDGWGIASQESKLFLWGGKGRGVVNAVFALLEEDLGCRWYSTECTQIPKTAVLEFAPVTRSYKPALKLRDPFYSVSWDWHWSLYNRTNAPDAAVPEEYGGRIDYGKWTKYGHMFVHTFDRLMPPSEYFDKHPEYFMLDENGNRSNQQLCTTNSEVIRIMTEEVLKFLALCPDTEIVSVSKNDMVKVCHCERCKAMDEAEGSHMASLLYLVNKVAEAVEKEHPNVDVSTLAYLETVDIPKTVRPRKNVIIRLCNDTVGAWNHPFTPAQDCKFAEILKKWSALHDKIFIWDYIINYSHFMAPMPNMDVIAKDIRFFVENNAQGVMTQGNCQGPGAEREWLRSWVIAKLMLYPTMDLDALMQDFILGYYGQAAEAMTQYNKLLRDQGEKFKDILKSPEGGIRYRMDNPFLSKEFLDQADLLFDTAEKLAENQDVLHRVQRDRLPIMYVKLVRGPEFTGEAYPKVLAGFEETAKRIKVTNLAEGPNDLDNKIKGWQKEWDDFKSKKN
jgi:hypothetical protein